MVAIAHGRHCPICEVDPLIFWVFSPTDLRIVRTTIRSNSKHALNEEIARASWSGSFGPPAALRGAEETPDPPGDACRCVCDVLTSSRRSFKVAGHAETSAPHGLSATLTHPSSSCRGRGRRCRSGTRPRRAEPPHHRSPRARGTAGRQRNPRPRPSARRRWLGSPR
jgi:hypothetical protein